MKKTAVTILLAYAWRCRLPPAARTKFGRFPSAAASPEETAESAAADLSGQSLLIYCGAGNAQPFQEIADAFKEEPAARWNVTYANATRSRRRSPNPRRAISSLRVLRMR
jgi:hypothetical protein